MIFIKINIGNHLRDLDHINKERPANNIGLIEWIVQFFDLFFCYKSTTAQSNKTLAASLKSDSITINIQIG